MATVAVQITSTWSDSQIAADKVVNVCHFDGGTDYESIGHSILMAFAGNPASGLPAFTAYSPAVEIEARVYDLADPKPRPERYYEKYNGDGGQVSQPRLLAAVLSFYSGRNQPSSRGRIFIGPVPASYVSGEQLTGGGQQDLIRLAQCLYATDGGTWNHVVYSQKLAAPTPTMTNYFVSSKWGVQHSRSLAQQSRVVWQPS